MLPSIILNNLAEKERINVFNLFKALNNSKVKIKGYDVVASYKLLYGMIIYPLFYLIWNFIFFIYWYLLIIKFFIS
jgi:hypothetical protein